MTNTIRAALFTIALAHAQIVQVPLPGGGEQAMIAWKPVEQTDPRGPSRLMARLATASTTTNKSVTLTLTNLPPFVVECSTNLVTWSYFDESTNSVWTITICPDQQAQAPVGFFRAVPLSRLARVIRGL